jgi:hypothetical protein
MTYRDLKPGFYYLKSKVTERCYYISGEKKGNRWCPIKEINGNELITVIYAGWNSLLWNCLPKDEELSMCEYSETNPTSYEF